MNLQAKTLYRFKKALKQAIVEKDIIFHHISIDGNAVDFTARIKDQEIFIQIPGKRIYGKKRLDLKLPSLQKTQRSLDEYISHNIRQKEKLTIARSFLLPVASPNVGLNGL